jgi:hypothetical protein
LELLICDRIKSKLSENALRHIMGLETNAKDNWLRFAEITEALDMFYDSYVARDKPSYVNTAVSNVGPIAKKQNDVSVAIVHSTPASVRSNVHTSDNTSRCAVVNSKRCFICDSPNHLQNYHSRIENHGKTQTGKSEKIKGHYISKRLNSTERPVQFS